MIIVRVATPEDASGIAYVHVKTWQHAYRGQIPDEYLDSLSIEKRTLTWRNQIEHPRQGTCTIVAEVDNKVVGWCTAGVSRDKNLTRDVGELYGIYVLPDYAGQGVGSKLMIEGLAFLKNEGYQRATLWVLETNKKSRDWYEHKGWKVEGATKTEKKDKFELHEVRYITDLV